MVYQQNKEGEEKCHWPFWEQKRSHPLDWCSSNEFLKVTEKAIKYTQCIVRDSKKRSDIIQKDSNGEKDQTCFLFEKDLSYPVHSLTHIYSLNAVEQSILKDN